MNKKCTAVPFHTSRKCKKSRLLYMVHHHHHHQQRSAYSIWASVWQHNKLWSFNSEPRDYKWRDQTWRSRSQLSLNHWQYNSSTVQSAMTFIRKWQSNISYKNTGCARSWGNSYGPRRSKGKKCCWKIVYPGETTVSFIIWDRNKHEVKNNNINNNKKKKNYSCTESVYVALCNCK